MKYSKVTKEQANTLLSLTNRPISETIRNYAVWSDSVEGLLFVKKNPGNLIEMEEISYDDMETIVKLGKV